MKAFLKKFCCVLELLLLETSISKGLFAQEMEKTMLEQIAKLETTLQLLKQGYAIVQKGLSDIRDIKKGDFDLHSVFFESLMEVKPGIKQYSKVADILRMDVQIMIGCGSALAKDISSGSFSSAEVTYFSAVYSHLKEMASQDMDELTRLMADGNWQMDDDDRISRINHLYVQVQEKYLFLRSFSDRILLEANWRTREKINLQNLSKLLNP